MWRQALPCSRSAWRLCQPTCAVDVAGLEKYQHQANGCPVVGLGLLCQHRAQTSARTPRQGPQDPKSQRGKSHQTVIPQRHPTTLPCPCPMSPGGERICLCQALGTWRGRGHHGSAACPRPPPRQEPTRPDPESSNTPTPACSLLCPRADPRPHSSPAPIVLVTGSFPSSGEKPCPCRSGQRPGDPDVAKAPAGHEGWAALSGVCHAGSVPGAWPRAEPRGGMRSPRAWRREPSEPTAAANNHEPGKQQRRKHPAKAVWVKLWAPAGRGL